VTGAFVECVERQLVPWDTACMDELHAKPLPNVRERLVGAALPGRNADTACGYSSVSFSLLMTAKSSNVVMSPLTSPLLASSRRSRRMILPERVLGN
jgi:hypothetical protein